MSGPSKPNDFRRVKKAAKSTFPVPNWLMTAGLPAPDTVAIVIAGLPGMVELWRNPQPFVARVWAGYTVANLLALAGGSAWVIEERFAPAVFSVQTTVLVLVGSRRKRGERTHVEAGRRRVEMPERVEKKHGPQVWKPAIQQIAKSALRVWCVCPALRDASLDTTLFTRIFR